MYNVMNHNFRVQERTKSPSDQRKTRIDVPTSSLPEGTLNKNIPAPLIAILQDAGSQMKKI
jgi:hypothetical protein